MTLINAERMAGRILNTSGCLMEAASWFKSSEAETMRPIDIARITTAMVARMRGGRIGEDLAAPEIFYAAVHEVATNGPRSIWPEDCPEDWPEDV